jgi:hypothetical protein
VSPFFRFLLKVTLALHLPVALALFGALAPRLGAGGALAAIGVALTASMWLAAGRIRGQLYDSPRSWWTIHLVDTPYFVHWCACVFTVIPSVLALLGVALSDLLRDVPLHLPYAFLQGVYGVGLVVGVWGVVVRRRLLAVQRVTLHFKDLPAAFDGYRIAHLSDLHIGSMTPKARALRWVARANAEKPDLAVVTGDFVTNGVAFHEDIANAVGELRGAEGTFASMGNHDYFGDGEPLLSLLAERGVQVLRNAGVALRRNEHTVYLAGIDDTWTRRADLERTLAGRAEDDFCVLLAHDPDVFPDAAARGVHLTLSGHTHAGQVAVPFLSRVLSLSHLAHRFHTGVYRRGPHTLFVHPGMGTTGPPIRVGAAPTLALLTLRRAP